MKKTIVPAALFILLCAVPAAAESPSGKIYAGSSLAGFSASTLSGAGAFYQFLITETFSIKATGLWYMNKKEKTNINYPGETRHYERLFWDAGGEIQKTVFSFKMADAGFESYFLIGGSYWHSTPHDAFDREDNFNNKRYALGLGAGARLTIASRIFADVSVTYQYTRYLSKINEYAGLGCGCSAGIIF